MLENRFFEEVSHPFQALNKIRLHFLETGRESMALFHENCLRLFYETNNPMSVPYLFAYSARSLLHNADHWWLDKNNTMKPTDFMIDNLDRIINSSKGIDCRRNYYYHVVSGIRDYITNDVDSAWKNFTLASQPADAALVFMNDDFGGGVSSARCFPRVTEDLSKPRHRDFAGRPTMLVNPGREATLRFVVAFDTLYAEAFGLAWIRQVALLSIASIGLHFHLILTKDESPTFIESFIDEAKRLTIDFSLSSEVAEVTDRTYFTCGRFLCCEALLEVLNTNLLICDADLTLKPIESFLSFDLPQLVSERKCKAIINPNYGHGYLPWRHVSASIFYVPATDSGRTYVSTVSKFIRYFWDDNAKSNWWIDQFSLEAARQFSSKTLGEMDVCTTISTRLQTMFITPSSYKGERLASVPKVRKLLEAGNNLQRALDILARQSVS